MSFCIMFAMQSCTSYDEPTMSETAESETSISHMVVKFEDRIYETDVMTVGDSVRYLNEEYAEVYQSKIRNNPDIAAVVSSDSIGTTYVDYFPTEKKLLEKYTFKQLSIEENSSVYNTRSNDIDTMIPGDQSTIIAIAELYDDRNFKDRKLISYATDWWGTAIPRLEGVGFNDKTSSIKVFNKMDPSKFYTIHYYDAEAAPNVFQSRTFRGDRLRPVLKCYHNSGYSGAVIYCISKLAGSVGMPGVPIQDHADTNLKNIGWNDRISAISWVLIYDFSVFNGDNPEIPAHKKC